MKSKTFLTYEKPFLTCMVQADNPDRIKELIDLSLPEGAEAIGMQFCKLREQYRNEKTYRELFAYTEKHVSHLLKKETGTGFSQHVSALRLAYARLLILSGENSVSAVALASGYRDALYFSKVFKKQYGCTPKEFIERARQGK